MTNQIVNGLEIRFYADEQTTQALSTICHLPLGNDRSHSCS